jgi:hypothetical protein
MLHAWACACCTLRRRARCNAGLENSRPACLVLSTFVPPTTEPTSAPANPPPSLPVDYREFCIAISVRSIQPHCSDSR